VAPERGCKAGGGKFPVACDRGSVPPEVEMEWCWPAARGIASWEKAIRKRVRPGVIEKGCWARLVVDRKEGLRVWSRFRPTSDPLLSVTFGSDLRQDFPSR